MRPRTALFHNERTVFIHVKHRPNTSPYSISSRYIITIVLTALVSTATCMPPFQRHSTTLNTNLSVDLEPHVLDWLTASSPTAIASHPLLGDLDLDGNPDLVFATVDGIVYGYQSIGKQPSERNVDSYSSNWSFVVRGEKFASSPVLVPFDDKGHSLIVVVSIRGVIYALDAEGTLVVQIQIPNLIVGPSGKRNTEWLFSNAHLRYAASHLHWHVDHLKTITPTRLDNSPGLQLQPRVYATALVPPVMHSHRPLTDSLDSDAIIIPVNFVPMADSPQTDVVLATLLGIPRRAFLSTHLWGSSRHGSDNPGHGFSIHLLEIGKMQDAKPPYLFASPSLVASPVPDFLLSTVLQPANRPTPSSSWHPSYQVLVPSFTGRLHVVRLPLRKLGDSRVANHEIWSNETYSFAESCVLMNCDPVNPQAARTVCCLLVDSASRLLLLSLNSHGTAVPSRQPPRSDAVSLLWTYTPRLLNSTRSHSEQLSQVTLVRCDSATAGHDQRWAVYPTPDGFLHSVDLNTGLPVTGYPLPLIPAEFADSVTFTVGPGLLYATADHEQWMLLTDTTGAMYHVVMCKTPTVLRSLAPLSHDIHHPAMRLSPIALLTLDETEPKREEFAPGVVTVSEAWHKLTVLILSENRAAVLSLNKTIHRLPDSVSTERFGPRTRPRFMMPTTGYVYFVDSSGHPVNRVRMETDQRVVHFRITNCPEIDARSVSNASGAYDTPLTSNTITPYVTQLIDWFGMPLSDWSIAQSTPSPSSCTGSCLAPVRSCAGLLSISRPFYGSFRGRLRLLAIDLRTGLLLTPYTSSSIEDPSAGSLLLEVETLWPQLLTLWTYLPVFYLFTGLILLHVSQQPHTSDSLSPPGLTKRSHSA